MISGPIAATRGDAIRVLVLYNEPVLPPDHPDAESEHEILFTAEAVVGHLTEAGYDVARLGVSHEPQVLLLGLREYQPDVVFNLFEGTGDRGGTETYVAGLLEWLEIPFTGCPSQALFLARNKPLTKRLLQGAGLPTADFFVVEELPVPPCALEWPVIVKPAEQDASVGLDQGSVVTDQDRLNERVAALLTTYGPPVLVEQFIRGREFNVAIIEAPLTLPSPPTPGGEGRVRAHPTLSPRGGGGRVRGARVLPISEILFVDKGPDHWPIVTYDAKWAPGSRDYEATPPRYPAKIGTRLAERLGTIASQAYYLLGCRDYARVDFRVRPPNRPYILEVNPNPDFSPSAGFSGALQSAGLTHAQFTVELVQAALARSRKLRGCEFFLQ